jgi:hypothetical protein
MRYRIILGQNYDSSGIAAQNLARVQKRLRPDVQGPDVEVNKRLCQQPFLVVFRSIDAVPHTSFTKKLALIGYK